MICVFSAKLTELFELELIRRLLLILGGRVVLPLTVRTI